MGSAHVTPTRVTSIYSAMTSFLFNDIEKDIENQEMTTRYKSLIPFARGYETDAEGDEIQQDLINEAVATAQQEGVGTVIICVGLPEIMESEGFDRGHVRLPKQHIALVEAVADVHKNVVVILSNGGIVEIPKSFVDGVKSILDGFLLGQAGGHALVDVLFGNVSPSGKLPETIPIRSEEDIPSSAFFPGTRDRVEYREGLDVGYRHFDSMKVPVRYPFGHGLQYTNFHYSNLFVTIQEDDVSSKRVLVSMDVQNIGNTSKHESAVFSKPVLETIQLYIRPIDSRVYRPYHELKNFAKVELSLGQTKTVEFELDTRSFSFYDVGLRDWVVENSVVFEIEVGASSRDIRLRQKISFQTGRNPSLQARTLYPPIVHAGAAVPEIIDINVNNNLYTKCIEKDDTTDTAPTPVLYSIPKNQQPTGDSCVCRNRNISRNTLLVEAAETSWIAGIILYISLKVAATEVKEGPTKKRELRMIRANVENLPLRGLVIFSRGNISFKLLDILIFIMNGEIGEAIYRAVRRKR